jgi:hypothetical protein
LTVFLAYLAKFFKPVQHLAKMTNAVAQTHVAFSYNESWAWSRYRAASDSGSALPVRSSGTHRS